MTNVAGLNGRIAVVDVETTGFHPKKNNRIVEIGALLLEPGGKIVGQFETLVNPERDIGPTKVHGIRSAEVLNAPRFEEIAGDLSAFLDGAQVFAAHNVSFDWGFLLAEYSRLGVELPDIFRLCTLRHFGGTSLSVCCNDLGIQRGGEAHTAIVDARATAQLVQLLLAENPNLLDEALRISVRWPALEASGTPCLPRQAAKATLGEEPPFLRRMMARIHHDVDATVPDVLTYMTLIDQVLEDRRIEKDEEQMLIKAADELQLTKKQIEEVHQGYLHSLLAQACADGVVTELEKQDLQDVAALLGYPRTSLEDLLQATEARLRKMLPNTGSGSQSPVSDDSGEMFGKRVCFTGALRASYQGESISRGIAEALATKAGMIPVGSVTKKTDVLVVADPDTQSGKAKKARRYGIQVLPEVTFWKRLGVEVQ